MSSRSYEMVDRARSVEQTRVSILDAAATLLSSDRYAEVSLDDVAGAADVSRRTIYHQFGSRQGLLEALTTATEERAEFTNVLAAANNGDPAMALADTCAELIRFVHQTAPLFDNLRSLADRDAGLRKMVQRKDRARRELVDTLISRISQAGGLRVPRSRANAIITALTSYEATRELLAASSSVSEAQAHIRWICQQLLARSG